MLNEAIKSLGADIVLLQEVAGSSKGGRNAPADVERAYQLEALADEIWPYHAYQKNSVFSGGYHGNAILSRYPIERWHNLNITVPRLPKRGILHAVLTLPKLNAPLHVLATHLGLLQYERHRQLKKLCQYVKNEIPHGEPIVIGGDFNDWRERVSDNLLEHLEMEEAFLKQDSRHARTFPSRMPVLRLDRIYFRGFQLGSALRLRGRPWNFLSDHLPVVAHFHLPHR